MLIKVVAQKRTDEEMLFFINVRESSHRNVYWRDEEEPLKSAFILTMSYCDGWPFQLDAS